MCPSFPFGIEGGIWDLIVLIPDHCLSIYFKTLTWPFRRHTLLITSKKKTLIIATRVLRFTIISILLFADWLQFIAFRGREILI